MKNGLASRRAALRLIDHVLNDRRPLDDLLDRPPLSRLSDRDRAFARLLAATVLRRLGELDRALTACLDRPLKGRALRAQGPLRLAAAELIFLDAPPHAAVDSAVSLVNPPAYRGLVNAVLRRLHRERPDRQSDVDAARVNCPTWLWRSWSEAYGEDRARAIARVHLGPASLDLTVRADPGAWAPRLDAECLPTGSLRRAPGEVGRLPGFAQGAWWVQDAAAALPARLLGPVEGLAVADLCAAPGGKTLQLAAAGAQVTAVDQSESRLARLRDNLERTGLTAALVAADIAGWQPGRRFDAVLLDAPCSATGTIRRHPDILRLKRPADIRAMADLQRRLLRAACDLLRPGGLMVFCTCSLQPEEGEQQAAWAAEHLPLRVRPIDSAEIGGETAWQTEGGALRTLPSDWPERGGLDGFFMARFERQG